MTDQRPTALEFALPGFWWHIPLVEPEGIKRTIHTIVESAIGRADDRAELRRELREQLRGSAESAAAAGGREFYLAREIQPGIPLSAAISVYWPLLKAVPSDVAKNGKLLRGFLKATLADSDGSAAPLTEQEFSVGESAVLRRDFLVLSEPGPDNEERGTFRVDYWLTVPGKPRVVLLAFSSSFVTMREQLNELFDAIVTTVRWGDLSAIPDEVEIALVPVPVSG
jgi:hypothetical protein